MAEIANAKETTKNNDVKYATDEAGMLRDAKDYARRDFTNTVEFVKNLTGKTVVKGEPQSDNEISEAYIAVVLIETKFEQIKRARTERVSYFD